VTGFATIAGTVMAAYIQLGISASYLLSASVMAAPAALGIAKLIYPEAKESKTTSKDIKLTKTEYAIKFRDDTMPLCCGMPELIFFVICSGHRIRMQSTQLPKVQCRARCSLDTLSRMLLPSSHL
jgi:hypothetical protein